MNRKNIVIIISILAFITIIGGVSYSYFVYSRNVGEVSLTTGKISIDLVGEAKSLNIPNILPRDDIDGKTSNDYVDFKIKSTVDTERIYYEIYLLPHKSNTLDTRYLKTYLTDQNDNLIKDIRTFSELGKSKKENGKVIYQGIVELNNTQTTKEENKDFRLRLWIDEDYSELTSKTFDFDIYLYAYNVDSDYVIN